MIAVVNGERWRAWAARIAVVVAAAVVGVSLHWLWRYANSDDPAMIEDPITVRVADAACARMRSETAAEALGIASPVRDRVAAIQAEDDSVLEMVAQIRALVPERALERDQPSLRWLDDWQRLVDARSAYARSLASGSPNVMVMPVVQGRSLVARINNVGLNCAVPLVLVAP